MIKRWARKSLRRIAQGPRTRTGRRALILLYHRVAELRSDPWRLSVTPRQFAEHLETLRLYAHPISLQQLYQGLREGNLPDRSVAITFDDGYADNLYNAKPLLERYAVPATVFLTTGYIGKEREFWWDELERLLLQPGTIPEVLSLTINGSTHRWKLGKAIYYSENDARRYHPWRAWKYLFSPRHRLYRTLWELLHPLTEGERQEVLDELLVWASSEPTARPTHRPLSTEEVVALAQGELVDVGAHTVTHPPLSTLPLVLQQDEVLRSKSRLEEILNRQVDGFAYPHGDLSPETVGIVREAGFAYACSALDDVVVQSTDRFQLPRALVVDGDREKFATQLSTWFAD